MVGVNVAKPLSFTVIMPCDEGIELSNTTVSGVVPAGIISFERMLNTPSVAAFIVTVSSFAVGVTPSTVILITAWSHSPLPVQTS